MAVWLGARSKHHLPIVIHLPCLCLCFRLTYETETILFLAVLENSVLHMAGPFSRDVKCDVRTLHFRSDVNVASP